MKRDAWVYRYVTAPLGRFSEAEQDELVRVEAYLRKTGNPTVGDPELEMEIGLVAHGHLEPGRGFVLAWASCDGQSFWLTDDEAIAIEDQVRDEEMDRWDAAREDAADHARELAREDGR